MVKPKSNKQLTSREIHDHPGKHFTAAEPTKAEQCALRETRVAKHKSNKPKSKKITGTRKYVRARLIPVICQRIASGETLTQICTEEDMPSHPLFCAWVLEDAAVADEYARARVARADVRADRIDDYRERMLRGEITPEQCRVATDSEKWQAGKEQPKRYGDKVGLEHTGSISLSISKDDAGVL